MLLGVFSSLRGLVCTAEFAHASCGCHCTIFVVVGSFVPQRAARTPCRRRGHSTRPVPWIVVAAIAVPILTDPYPAE